MLSRQPGRTAEVRDEAGIGLAFAPSAGISAKTASLETITVLPRLSAGSGRRRRRGTQWYETAVLCDVDMRGSVRRDMV